MNENTAQNYNPDAYNVGDADTRPWGKWEVIGISEKDGEQHVEKHITVIPGGILSYQSHELRREKWTVVKGRLRVTLNDQIIDLNEGQSIDIPLKAKHRMANPFEEDVVVHEVQMGICKESDIIRYEDSYGRS